MVSDYVEKLNEELAEFIGGWYRVSRKGVPHVVFPINLNTSGSACYFARMKKWRVFYPYGKLGVMQIKKTLHDINEVIDYIDGLRSEKLRVK